jgi:hypothetical protein
MAIRLTSKPWFGPKKHVGWGWSPISWEGYAATAVLLVVLFGSLIALPRSAFAYIVAAVVCSAYLLLVVLTGDPPGGPKL